jgi:hypothetical protein
MPVTKTIQRDCLDSQFIKLLIHFAGIHMASAVARKVHCDQAGSSADFEHGLAFQINGRDRLQDCAVACMVVHHREMPSWKPAGLANRCNREGRDGFDRPEFLFSCIQFCPLAGQICD